MKIQIKIARVNKTLIDKKIFELETASLIKEPTKFKDDYIYDIEIEYTDYKQLKQYIDEISKVRR